MADEHLKRSASLGGTRREEPSFEEDPLVELARIVAEDGGFYRQGRAPDLRPARNEPARREMLSPEASLANELEAELMQNLDTLPRRRNDFPHQRPLTEVRALGAPECQPAHVPLRPAAAGQHHQASGLAQIPVEHGRPQPPARSGWDERPMPAAEQRAPEAAVPGREAASPSQVEEWRAPKSFVPDRLAERFEDDINALYAEDLESQDVDPDLETAGEGSAEMAAPGYAEIYPAEYEYADSDPEDGSVEHGETAPLPEHRVPPRGRRSYKSLLAAAGVLGVVVLGGAVTAMIGVEGPGSDSAPPPVIKAEAGPAKVVPEGTEQAQAGDSAGQAVYDRVAGRAPKSDEKLVDRAEEPRQVSRVILPESAEAAEPAPADAASPGSVELTGAVTRPDTAAAEERIAGQISSETASMQSGPRLDPVGPRRVRTVTVRPDGTILTAPAQTQMAEAPSAAAREVETDFGGEAPKAVPVRTVTVNTDQSPSGAPAAQPEAADPASTAAPQALLPVAESRPAEEAEPAQTEAANADPSAEAESQVAMLPRARPDAVPAGFAQRAAAPARESRPAEARPAAAPRNGEPVNLLAASPASPRAQAQAPRPAAPGSPYAVQLSAQRSEDQARAAFTGLKSKFPSILGSHAAEIERADLGERGIYYRVRVGAQTQAEAVQLCEQLKAAGGSCFVSR